MQILCVTPEPGGGWAPVNAMAALAGQAFNAPVTFSHPTKIYSMPRKIASLTPRLRGRNGTLLAILAGPGNLLELIDWAWWGGRFNQVAVWIFDAFWTEHLPRFARLGLGIDHVFVTDAELVDHYAQTMRTPATWLPWGTDTLHPTLTSAAQARPVDVQRLGRQPQQWDDDASNEAAFGELGLRYEGRFDLHGDAAANYAEVLRRLAQAKFVLASSNAVSGADYTHRTREYITARWCDAAAAGTIVAGQPPRCEAVTLLPEEGLLRIPVEDLQQSRELIANETAQWSLERAQRVRAEAMRTLDWRHRFVTLSKVLGEPGRVSDEVARLGL